MRRSSSGARVSEGGDAPSSSAAAAGHHGDGAGLPTFDPQSAAGRREAARTRALGRAVHCIPVLLVLCVLVLWLSSTSPVHIGLPTSFMHFIDPESLIDILCCVHHSHPALVFY